nr:hypothetical protein BGP89_13550 [Luteimonas sp. JM171]
MARVLKVPDDCACSDIFRLENGYKIPAKTESHELAFEVLQVVCEIHSIPQDSDSAGQIRLLEDA